MCGQPYRSDSFGQLETNSVLLSMTQSLPADAATRLSEGREKFSQSECVGGVQKAEVQHLDGLDDVSPPHSSSSGSPSKL